MTNLYNLGNRRVPLLAICVLQMLLGFFSARVVAEDVKVTIAQTALTIPSPPDFIDPATVSSKLRAGLEKFTSPNQRLLAIWVSESDVKQIQSGVSKPPLSTFRVVTRAKDADAVMSQEEFEALKTEIHRRSKTWLSDSLKKAKPLIDSAVKSANKDAGLASLNLSVAEVSQAQIFDESADSISTVATERIDVGGAVNPDTRLIGTVAVMMRIHGRLLILYVHHGVSSEADIEWLKVHSLGWQQQVRDENP